MSTILKYINQFGQEISKEQTKSLNLYRELVNDAGQMIEHVYSNGVLISNHYLVDSYDVLALLLQQDRNASFTIKKTVNNYRLTEQLGYKDAVLKYKSAVVLDVANNPICWLKYDPITSLPDYLSTEKVTLTAAVKSFISLLTMKTEAVSPSILYNSIRIGKLWPTG
jgi:hypothetical protein